MNLWINEKDTMPHHNNAVWINPGYYGFPSIGVQRGDYTEDGEYVPVNWVDILCNESVNRDEDIYWMPLQYPDGDKP